MKRNKLALIAVLAALLSFGVSSANAIPEAQAKSIKSTLASTPVLELAPKAAEIVLKASANDREEVAVTVVRTIVSKKPTVARDVVVAIVKVAPEVSAAVASAAAKLVPSQAGVIARDAAAYAPAQARSIAAAVANVSPNSAVRVTKEVVAVDPDQAPEIIEAVILAVPASKENIQADSTLKIVSTLARNTRSNAGTKRVVTSIPRLIFTAPVQASAPTITPRTSALINAINDLRNLPSLAPANVDLSAISAVSISTVEALNTIGKDTLLSRQEKDSILLATVGVVKTIVVDPDIPSTAKGSAGVAAANAIKVVVADQDASVDAKKILVDYTAQKITQLATSSTTGVALGESIKAVAGEVQKVIAAVQNITPAQAQAALAQVETNVENIKKAYGSP
jgi:hypothetical protein